MNESSRPLLFGVLVDELEGSYQALALRGLKDAAGHLGVNLLYFPGHAMGAAFGFDREFNVVYQLARDAHLDGIIALVDTFDRALPPGGFEQFVAGLGSIPVVCIGGAARAGMSSIVSDIRGGMEQLVDHFLHDHGYRRIVFLKGLEGNTDARLRLEAFLARHEAARLPVDPQLLVEGNFSPSTVAAGMDALLDGGVPFDAVLAANDEMALAAMARLASRELLVPEQVAVAGYDDLAGQGNIPIPLSSVDQDVPGMAALAVRHLADRIAGRAGAARFTVPARMRLRYSCGCSVDGRSQHFGHVWVDPRRGQRLTEELTLALHADMQAEHAHPGAQRSDRFGQALRRRLVRADQEHGALEDLRTSLRLLSARLLRQAQEMTREQERWITHRLLEAQNGLFMQEQTLRAEQMLRQHVRSRDLWCRIGQAPDVRGFRIDQLLPPLQNALLQLGLKTVLMVLYPQPVHAEAWNRFTVPQELTLAMAVIDGVPVPVDQLGPFAAQRFLPVSPYGWRAGMACSVFPLFLHSQHFGYLVLDVTRDLEQTFEEVRSDVASLITSTALIGELFRAGELLREDLTRQRAANHQLSTLAQHDELTGLLNRRGFFARVEDLRARDLAREAVLLAIDLDGLKQINDEFGHAAGDKALKAAALVLAGTFRERDAVARLGGDEFAVFTRQANNRVLPRILQRLQQRLEAHNSASGDPWSVAFSVGSHALEPGTAEPLEQALAQADRALYAIKRQRKEAQVQAAAATAAALARARGRSDPRRRRPR